MSKDRYRRVANECTAATLRRAARALSNFYDERIAPTGLRGTQFSLLVAVALAEEMPLSRLAEILSLERTTLTRNLGPLVRDGLLESATGEDRRVHLVRMTAKGRAALERALPLWDQAQQQIVKALGTTQWQTLVSLSRKAAQICTESETA